MARLMLAFLLASIALNAFGGGYYGMAGAKDVPLEWLEGSPFSDYFIPSLILFFAVGITFLAAAIAVFARLAYARHLCIASGVLLLGWIAAQMAVIGFVSWLQPLMAMAGWIILGLVWRLSLKGGF